MEHEAVKTPEKCGKGFASPGRGEDECAFAAGDNRPPETLRRSWRVEHCVEPLGCYGVETSKGIGFAVRLGGGNGHLLL